MPLISEGVGGGLCSRERMVEVTLRIKIQMIHTVNIITHTRKRTKITANIKIGTGLVMLGNI